MSDPFGMWFGCSHLGFGTHMPILAAAVMQSRPGPVLEYGVGFYSTPMLHLLCAETGRKLLSLEGDPPWAEKFGGMRHEDHRIVGVSSWPDSEALVDETPEWSVVFIDHGPDERRVVDARRLANRAEFVVVHDWEQPMTPSQEELAALFRFSWVSRMGPLTTVLSNVRPFLGI